VASTSARRVVLGDDGIGVHMTTTSAAAAVSPIMGVNLVTTASMASEVAASVTSKVTASVTAVVATALRQVNADVDVLASEGGFAPNCRAGQQKRTDLGLGGGKLG